MKKLTPLLAGVVLMAGAAVCPPAYGEFVHLSFSASESSLGLRGNQAGEPWDTGGYVTGLRPLRLEIFYDPGVPAASAGDGYARYTFTDPAMAFWRLSTSSYHLPPLKIERPLDSIDIDTFGHSLTFAFLRSTPDVYETFDMLLHFDTAFATGLSLPTPPFPRFLPGDEGLNYFTATGGEDLFNLPDPGSGTVSAIFTSMRAEVVDTIPPFVPVPEPSTYGITGALALAALAAVRRRAGLLARILPRLRRQRAGLAALTLLVLGAASPGSASLILYARQGGPMEWTYLSPVAAQFTLTEASRILAVKTWVNGGSREEPAIVDLSVSPQLNSSGLYSTSYAISPVYDAPAKWQAITGLKFDLQPGDYWLKFEGGIYPLGYGYYGPTPDAPYPEAFASTGFDGPEWEEIGFPFGLQVYAVPLSAVPEPATYGLVAAFGLSGLAAWRRLRREAGSRQTS